MELLEAASSGSRLRRRCGQGGRRAIRFRSPVLRSPWACSCSASTASTATASAISAVAAATMNQLAKILDEYNNNR